MQGFVTIKYEIYKKPNKNNEVIIYRKDTMLLYSILNLPSNFFSSIISTNESFKIKFNDV